MKKLRFYAGITLIVQSISFAIIFLLLYKKKKSLAKTFAALSAAGGVAGAYLLVREAQENTKRERMLAMDACCDMSDDDFLEEDNGEVSEEDISCSFEDDDFEDVEPEVSGESEDQSEEVAPEDE